MDHDSGVTLGQVEIAEKSNAGRDAKDLAFAAELFRRYADEGASIAELTRWLTEQGVATRTGKHRWDRSVIWGMLRNP
ncbi:MAG TPA: recombinase family protein, partial [Amycolatopsis sp.]|uniref:recombinase family protein n=1 Tax=Amycolatopsis sp. TaxID=37632 RepID=UPI002B48A73A